MTRSTHLSGLAFMMGLGAACGSPVETILPPPPPPGLTGAAPFLVSNSVTSAAFVSLSPGTLPGVTAVRIRVHRNGVVVTAALAEGGLDPVAIPAIAGDTITLTATGPSGPESVLVFLLPPRKPPVIVRTQPRKNRRDVPVNLKIQVVFSEPIDSTSLTPQNFELRSGSNRVAGRLGFVNPEHTIVEFVPGQDLAPATEYELVLGTGLRDLEGTALETGETIAFATAAGPVQPGEIAVTTVTSGPDLAPNGGYWISVDGGPARPIGVNGSISFGDFQPGPHTVALTGAGVNCLAGANPRTVTVASGGRVNVEFVMTCAVAPLTQLAFVRDGQIHLVNSDGTGIVQLTHTGPGVWNGDPAWSPDGRLIAFASNRDGRSSNVYVMNADGSNVVQRTALDYAADPAWSPDGRTIAVTLLQDGSSGVFVIAADGSQTSRVVLNRPGYDGQPAWSPDGRKIAFSSDWRAYDFMYDLYVMNADGSGVLPLLEGPFFTPSTDYVQSAWSPDGQKIAVVGCFRWSYYACYPESHVAVISADGSGLTVLAPAGGHASPTWSPDGRTIAFGSTCAGCQPSLRFVRADRSAEGLIVTNGHSPAWRP